MYTVGPNGLEFCFRFHTNTSQFRKDWLKFGITYAGHIICRNGTMPTSQTMFKKPKIDMRHMLPPSDNKCSGIPLLTEF